MTEAVTINNEELAILCDIVGGWSVKKWAENPGRVAPIVRPPAATPKTPPPPPQQDYPRRKRRWTSDPAFWVLWLA